MRDDIYDAMAKHEDNHWWFHGRRAILAQVMAGLDLPPNAQILEVGAGTGGNTDMLRRFGRVVSQDASARARQYLWEKTHTVALDGFLPDTTSLHGNLFDAIVLFDVLEHIDHDEATVKALAAHLNPGGYLVFSVPAYPWLWGQHDVAHHHFRRYTKSSLLSVIDRVGTLTVVRVGFFNTILFPLIAGIRMAQRLTHHGGSDQDKIPSPVVNRMLKRLFSSEARIACSGRLPFGVSLLLVAQVPR